MSETDKTLILIAGPTAVGKTAVALEVAKHYATSIISADSRQCFKELSIGVARPSVEELAEVPHYFIASHSIHETVTAAGFEAYALQKAAAVFETNNVVVVTGGTGLYINALCNGLDIIPEVPVAIREAIMRNYQQHGLAWLQEETKKADLQFYNNGETQNPQRLMRALEVVRSTGTSILSFRKGATQIRPFRIIKIGLELPRDVLYKRINSRVDKMIAEGLEEEAKHLQPYQNLNALQTVGYKELFDYFNGKLTWATAGEKIKTSTRRYAKRQMTWFKKDKDYAWSPPDAEGILKLTKSFIRQ